MPASATRQPISTIVGSWKQVKAQRGVLEINFKNTTLRFDCFEQIQNLLKPV